MTKNIRCPQCNGTGTVGTKKQNGICFKCGGAKQLTVSQQQYDRWKKKEEAQTKTCGTCNKKQTVTAYRSNGHKCIRCDREMSP